MKVFVLVFVISLASCCSGKSNRSGASSNTNAGDSTVVNYKTPDCIRVLIAGFEKEAVQNPPRKIYSYSYQNKTVYYIPAICCDFFSDLYDDDCKLIGHPDGGITGRGDGTVRDFDSARSNERLIWADKRK